MSLTKYNARAFARMGQSGALFGMAAVALREHYPIMCVAADMSTPAGLDRFKRLYPEAFVNVGIAEQNMLGISAGLAAEGFQPVCVTQAAFLSMRAFEQVRQYMGYMRYPVIAVGLSAGFALSYLGNTHYAIEDLAVMRAIPGMHIFSPADAGAAVKAVEKAVELRVPTYIRLTAGLMPPIVYADDYTFDPHTISELSNTGCDAAIFATGSMVHQSLLAAQALTQEGIGCTVYDVACIKPLDVDTVRRACRYRHIFTVEEHSIVGGLGSAVAEVLAAEAQHAPLTRIGVNDTFSAVGDYNYLLDQHRLTAPHIAAAIRTALSK